LRKKGPGTGHRVGGAAESAGGRCRRCACDRRRGMSNPPSEHHSHSFACVQPGKVVASCVRRFQRASSYQITGQARQSPCGKENGRAEVWVVSARALICTLAATGQGGQTVIGFVRATRQPYGAEWAERVSAAATSADRKDVCTRPPCPGRSSPRLRKPSPWARPGGCCGAPSLDRIRRRRRCRSC
jgi:hypothetical protein